MWTEDTRTHK